MGHSAWTPPITITGIQPTEADNIQEGLVLPSAPGILQGADNQQAGDPLPNISIPPAADREI